MADMGLLRKAKAELIDIIEYIDSDKSILAYCFERYGNEIKNNAKLVVREGQVAIFVNEGKLADVFSPGTYTLNTQNMPVLSTLKGWKYGFNSPFKAEVYFVDTSNHLNQKWGTKTPIIMNDNRFGMIELRAFGNYTFKVSDAATLLREVVSTQKAFKTNDISDQLSSIILTRFSDAAAEADLLIEQYASNLNELSALVFNHVQDDFLRYGIQITNFLIENISMPESVKREIFEFSRLSKVDMHELTQLKSAKAIENASLSSSGSGAMNTAMGIGAGMAMGRKMASVMSEDVPANRNVNTPPPLPNHTEFYVSLNGQPAGPYNKVQLRELAKDKNINQSSFVWKPGLEDWCEAKVLAELNDIWPVTPPPIPER